MRQAHHAALRREPRNHETLHPLRVVRPDAPREPDARRESEPLWKAALVSLRPLQWAKNLLLFAPLVLAHELANWAKWANLVAAFAVFSACASAVYLVNDLIDLDADRRHPVKQHRPLAAGTLSVRTAMFLAAMLLAGAFGASAALLSWAFTAMLAAYLAITTAYSMYLKRTLVLDVLVLAGLYSQRLLAGGIVAGVEVSQWLMSFSMFLFTSLALLKRYGELRRAAVDGDVPNNRRGYLPGDAETIHTLGLASGCLSVLVLCLYISNHVVERLYRRPDALWLIAPALLYWLGRLWLLARRGEIDEDPLAVALKDPRSYVVGLVCAALLVAGSV